jgi:hypothetical protein
MISENSPDRPDILRLRHHPDDLFALVGATAEHLRLDPAFVEKDFWVTELLRSLIRPMGATAVDKTSPWCSKVARACQRCTGLWIASRRMSTSFSYARAWARGSAIGFSNTFANGSEQIWTSTPTHVG